MLQQITFKNEIEGLPRWSTGYDPNSGDLSLIPGQELDSTYSSKVSMLQLKIRHAAKKIEDTASHN